MTASKKRWLAASVSALAIGCITTTPTLAADLFDPQPEPGRVISGNLEIFGGYTFLDGSAVTGSEDSDFPSFGGGASVDIPFNENWSLQLDVDGEVGFPDGSDSTSESDGYGGHGTVGAHLNFREVDRYLFGAFGGAGGLSVQDTSGGAAGPTGEGAAFYFIGVEGQMYFGDTTLYAQGGYLDTDFESNTDVMEDVWFIRGVLRHYLNAGNTMLQGELGYAEGDMANASVADADVVSWGAKLEHVFHSWGNEGFVSAYVEYNGRHFEENGSADTDEFTDHTFMVGVSFDINQPNLKSRERTGVALDLPKFARHVVGVAPVD